MSRIFIERDVDLSDEDVASLRELITKELRGHGIGTEWEGDLAKVRSRSVKGDCILSNSRVEIDLKLDFFTSMFKSTIEEHLLAYLDDLA